ncbi:23S rRNA (adenine(2503)-C(2))-methyltransferase RlmN, partial [Enterococcus faecalis]
MQEESIYGLTREQLVDGFLAHGEKKFRATQVWKWLYTKRVVT